MLVLYKIGTNTDCIAEEVKKIKSMNTPGDTQRSRESLLKEIIDCYTSKVCILLPSIDKWMDKSNDSTVLLRGNLQV